jgi:signal transduction histidine kinase
MTVRASFLRSARVRLAVFYTVVVFGLGALVIGTINFSISRSLDANPVTEDLQIRRTSSEPGAAVFIDSISLETIEQLANQETLEQLQNLSLLTLAVLLPVSLVTGWFVAGRFLRPLDEVTRVAREIQASNLSRRIEMEGPDDELKNLADTFDEMLDRIEQGIEDQRQFVADISHELRNPLATMSMSLDVVLSSEDAGVDDYRQTSEVLRRSIDRTARTVDDLMRFARRETPATVGESPVDLGLLAQEVMSELRIPAAKRSLRLRVLAEGGPWVRVDREALRTAVSNLAGNAVRLAPAKTVVTCGAGSHGGWAWIGVRDQGPGIEAAEHRFVFQRNWGRDRTRLHREQRSGLGLSIVRHVAEACGGTVTLNSSRSTGSSFVIWIPLEDDLHPSSLTIDGIHPVEDPLFDS